MAHVNRVALGSVIGERRPQDHDRAARLGFAGSALESLIWWGSTVNYRVHGFPGWEVSRD